MTTEHGATGTPSNAITREAATTNISDADAETQALWNQGIIGQSTRADGTVVNIYRPGWGPNGQIGETSAPEIEASEGAVDPSLNRFAKFNADGTVQGSENRNPNDIATYGVRNERPTNASPVGDGVTAVDRSNAQAAAGPDTETPTGINNPNVQSEKLNHRDSGVWQEFYPTVQGRHNILHDYNSYNYIITLVSISTDQLNDPESYKGRIVNATGVESDSFYVIARSGGYTRADAVTNPQSDFDGAVGVQSFKGEAGERSRDLFIENLEFDTRPGINDMGNSNLTTGTFEITEPHSVSQFYRELFNSAKFSGHPDYIDAPFLLVISFVGRKADVDEAEVPEQSTRYLPIRIQNSDMEVTEAGARYTVKFAGYNSTGDRGPQYSTLWEDTTPLQGNLESVESVVASVFLKHTRFEATRMEQFLRDLRSDPERETELQNLTRNETVIQSASRAGVQGNIGFYLPHKYYVWFASGHDTGFPATAKDLGAKSGSWESTVAAWTDNTGFEGRPTVTGIAPGTGNPMGDAGLNDLIAPSGAIRVQSFEDQLQDYRQEIQAKEDLIRSQQGLVETELRTFEGLRDELSDLVNKSQSIREDTTQTDFSPDLTASPSNRANELINQVNDATEQAINLANNIEQASASGPVQSNLSAAEVAQVVSLKEQIETSAGRVRTLYASQQQYQDELEELQKEAGNYASGGDTRFDLRNTSTEPWSFRKGTSLRTVIDTMITNSQYMNIFQNEGELSAIQTTEFVPWFNTEILTNIIGFDVATMRFVYEFHYVVSPYNVHYSKIPGVNVVFSTEQLKQRAVREYNYIYTGKNIDVLGYNIKYNNLFTVPLLINPPNFTPPSQTAAEETVNMVIDGDAAAQLIEDAVQTNINGQVGFTPTTPTTRLSYRQSPTNRNAIGIIFQDFLYNPPFEQHLILSDLEIVGDPVFVVGAGIADRPRLNNNDITTSDGEMNCFTKEPDVVLNIRYPEDIPTAAELESGQYEQNLMRDQYSGVFQIYKVTNRFAEGVFSQTLRLARRRNQPEDYVVYTETGQAPQNEGGGT